MMTMTKMKVTNIDCRIYNVDTRAWNDVIAILTECTLCTLQQNKMQVHLQYAR